MPPITIGQLTASCLHAPAARLAEILPHLLRALDEAHCNTPERAAMFIEQCAHESAQFTRFEENLNYSAEALLKTWPRHFTPEVAAVYAHQPEKIGNRAYADRMGNGDEESGDGWRFRGRAALMLTGFEAYLRFFRETGIDVVASPDVLAKPEYALLGAAKVWTWKGLNVYADRRDVKGCTHAINGGYIGEADREAGFARGLTALGAAA